MGEGSVVQHNTHGPHSLTMAAEDYLEAIYRLVTEGDVVDNAGVRSVDVAELLGVSKASVNKALTSLRENGMIEQARYGRVRLTDTGFEYARDVWHRHCTLRLFLTHELGVDEKTADEEACLMEHALSADTMCRWCDYLVAQGVRIEC